MTDVFLSWILLLMYIAIGLACWMAGVQIITGPWNWYTKIAKNLGWTKLQSRIDALNLFLVLSAIWLILASPFLVAAVIMWGNVE